MTAIVINTLTGAASEYDWSLPALCATHVGSDAGLFAIGGADDAGAQIPGSWSTGVAPRATTLKTALESAYLTMRGDEDSFGTFTVFGASDSWDYEFPVRKEGVSRAVFGRGIRENVLGFGYSNLDGADFQIDSIEVKNMPSTQRRM